MRVVRMTDSEVDTAVLALRMAANREKDVMAQSLDGKGRAMAGHAGAVRTSLRLIERFDKLRGKIYEARIITT